MTAGQTAVITRLPRVADPARFKAESGASRAVVVLVGCALLLGGILAAVPRGIPGTALMTLLGGAWLSLVLALTLPTRGARAGAELARRLGQFRHEVNTLGDNPTRAALESLIGRARELELRDHEIGEELARIRATLAALDLASRLAADSLPVVETTGPLAPGDACHFIAAVRFGRRRSDHFGHLMLTGGWLKFRGAVEVSVGWSQVSAVQRAGRDVIVRLRDSRRQLRFTCQSIDEATPAGVIAQYLAAAAGSEYEVSA